MVLQEKQEGIEMVSLGSDTLVLITNIGVFVVPLAAIVVLLPQLLPVTLAYFCDIAPLQRNILLCCLLLAIFTDVFREGVFDVILAVLPNSALIIVLSTLAPLFVVRGPVNGQGFAILLRR